MLYLAVGVNMLNRHYEFNPGTMHCIISSPQNLHAVPMTDMNIAIQYRGSTCIREPILD